jgi:hypothetical protein
MPQTTYLPVFTADYPILAKAQKPGGVTVLSAVSAGDVPNKPTYSAGTIQMTMLLAATEEVVSEVEGTGPAEEAEPVEEAEFVEEAEPVEESHPSRSSRKPKTRR